MRLATLALLTGCRFSAELPAGTPIDALPDAGLCATAPSAECVGDILRECKEANMQAVDTACNWGCTTLPVARCQRLEPHGGGATAADVNGTDLREVILAAGTTIDGDDGRIGHELDPVAVRMAGDGIVDGIDYQQRANNIAVFRFASLTINMSPNERPALILTGTRSIVLVADGDIVVEGVIDARGTCAPTIAGPGGKPGLDHNTVLAAMMGTGESTDVDVNGGGGGGHAGVGGVGYPNKLGGTVFGNAEITVLVGGGGGGGGGGGNEAGDGGGGGGAVQLVSNGKIWIKGTGGINAGGCGGETGRGGSDGGGGGGAGGTILLEAKEVVVDGILAVNGGGGGGGDVEPDAARKSGENGKLGSEPALGFPGPHAAGGNGGAGTMLDGSPGLTGNGDGGGGGGAAGRIRINTKSGAPALGAGAILSPAHGTTATTFGTVRLD